MNRKFKALKPANMQIKNIKNNLFIKFSFKNKQKKWTCVCNIKIKDDLGNKIYMVTFIFI
jgi:hypothetical protein